MNIPKKRLAILFILWSLMIGNVAVAQTDLRKDSSFFLSKATEIKKILKNDGIDQFYRLASIEVKQTKIIVNFNSAQSTSDSAIVAWGILQTKYDSIPEYRVAKSLFNTLAFEMEIGKDSLELILGANVKDFVVYIKHDPLSGVLINEGFKAPKRTFKTIVIKNNELSISSKSSKVSNDELTIKEIRSVISNYLKNYYKSKGTFFYDSELDVLKDNSNELTFEVSKLSKEILKDRDYFEFIRIDVKIQKNDKDFEIKYQVQGKYGSGIGFAPRRSEYKNMEPEYADYLNRYEEKLVQNINQLLTR